jgi:hypothetical protein
MSKLQHAAQWVAASKSILFLVAFAAFLLMASYRMQQLEADIVNTTAALGSLGKEVVALREHATRSFTAPLMSRVQTVEADLAETKESIRRATAAENESENAPPSSDDTSSGAPVARLEALEASLSEVKRALGAFHIPGSDETLRTANEALFDKVEVALNAERAKINNTLLVFSLLAWREHGFQPKQTLLPFKPGMPSREDRVSLRHAKVGETVVGFRVCLPRNASHDSLVSFDTSEETALPSPPSGISSSFQATLTICGHTPCIATGNPYMHGRVASARPSDQNRLNSHSQVLVVPFGHEPAWKPIGSPAPKVIVFDRADAVASNEDQVFVVGPDVSGEPGTSRRFALQLVCYNPHVSKSIWARAIGVFGSQPRRMLLAVGKDAVYVAGEGVTQIHDAGKLSEGPFIAAYNLKDGGLLHSMDGDSFPDAMRGINAITAGDSGLYIAGSCMRAGDQGGSPRQAHNQDVFLAAYDLRGKQRWTHSYGTPAHDVGTCLTLGSDGSIYVVGMTEVGRIDNSYGGMFLSRFSDDGAELYTVYFGGPPGTDRPNAITFHGGSIFVVGSTQGELDFRLVPLERNYFGSSGSDAFLAELNAADGGQLANMVQLGARHVGETASAHGIVIENDVAHVVGVRGAGDLKHHFFHLFWQMPPAHCEQARRPPVDNNL